MPSDLDLMICKDCLTHGNRVVTCFYGDNLCYSCLQARVRNFYRYLAGTFPELGLRRRQLRGMRRFQAALSRGFINAGEWLFQRDVAYAWLTDIGIWFQDRSEKP